MDRNDSPFCEASVSGIDWQGSTDEIAADMGMPPANVAHALNIQSIPPSYDSDDEDLAGNDYNMADAQNDAADEIMNDSDDADDMPATDAAGNEDSQIGPDLTMEDASVLAPEDRAAMHALEIAHKPPVQGGKLFPESASNVSDSDHITRSNSIDADQEGLQNDEQVDRPDMEAANKSARIEQDSAGNISGEAHASSETAIDEHAPGSDQTRTFHGPNPEALDMSFFLRKKAEQERQPKKRMTEAEKERQLAIVAGLRAEVHRRRLVKEQGASTTLSENGLSSNGHHASDTITGVDDVNTVRSSIVPGSRKGSGESPQDFSWMDEIEETDDETAKQSFLEKKKAYKAKKKSGKATVTDEADFIKVKQDEERRLEKQKQTALFVSDSEYSDLDGAIMPADPIARDLLQEVCDGMAKASSDARNARQADIALKSQRVPVPKRKPGRLKKVTDASMPKAKKQKRSYNKRNPADNVNFATMFGRDTLGAAALNEGQGQQPGFTDRRKDKALAQLLASIPEEDRKAAGSDKKELLKASKKFHGNGSIKSDGKGGWLLKGMTSSLQHHQLLGAGWMRDKETGPTEPRGGILADEMGIGKTVMAIANILDGNNKDPGARPTLIVAPSGLLAQWRRELKKHVRENKLSNLITVCKRDRANIIDPERDLGMRDIVLTSYHELMDQFPKYSPPITLDTEEQKRRWWEEHLEECKGPLFRLDWQRVVFDECQSLKNHESRTAKAATALSVTHRWLMSGTPLINGIEEFYSYFRVLQIQTGDMQLFKRNYKRTGAGYQRLNAILQSILMRRTYSTRMFNKPIVTLPKNTKKTLTVHFSPIERAMYEIVENRFVERIRAFAHTAPSHTSYTIIFVMLLRLRQLASHLFLIQETIEDLLEEQDIRKLMRVVNEELNKEGESSTKRALRELRGVMMKKIQSKVDAEGFQVLEVEERSTPKPNKEQSPGQLAQFDNPAARLKQHLEHLAHEKNFKELTSPRSGGRKAAKNNWFAENGHRFPSAKFMAVKMQIITWQEEAPGDKIIVFSQFTKVLTYLGRMCDEEGWQNLEYHGGMTLPQRDSALQKFQIDPNIKILLTSLKAGGTGLNLVMANKIINMEPWWNLAIESQAYCRVFRLGQDKETEVVRFVAENTVDDKLLAMQRKKCQEINGVMDPAKQLTHKELLQLFDRDENGERYIWPDNKSYRTPPPHSRKRGRQATDDEDESSSDF
ncbi:MAG: hypothetical protein MMC23_005815 [Stictis urceolatum]|nr:hypothetical protein [Stictis urceolata]